MPGGGVEPPRLAAADFKSAMATDYIIRAVCLSASRTLIVFRHDAEGRVIQGTLGYMSGHPVPSAALMIDLPVPHHLRALS